MQNANAQQKAVHRFLFADDYRRIVQVYIELFFHGAAFDDVHVVELVVFYADDTIAYALIQ